MYIHYIFSTQIQLSFNFLPEKKKDFKIEQRQIEKTPGMKKMNDPPKIEKI